MDSGLAAFTTLAQIHTGINDTAKNPHCDFCNLAREKKDLSALHKVYDQYSLSCFSDRREIRFCNDTGECLLQAYKQSLKFNYKP
jgi:hypothetical protein